MAGRLLHQRCPSDSGNQAGYAGVGTFNPTTDTEIFLLKLSSSAAAGTLITDINGTSGQTGGLVASAVLSALANYEGIAWDVELTAFSPATPKWVLWLQLGQ